MTHLLAEQYYLYIIFTGLYTYFKKTPKFSYMGKSYSHPHEYFEHSFKRKTKILLGELSLPLGKLFNP